MSEVRSSSIRGGEGVIALVVLLAVGMALPFSLYGAEKKKKKGAEPPKPPVLEMLDYSKIVWPQPPAIARVKYTTYFAGEKIELSPTKKKQSWMDRVAGTQPASENPKLRFQLFEPYGMAVDSKARLYVADVRVGAIFIFNTDTRDVALIKNGMHAHFGRITDLAMDDSDRLFVSDTELRHVLVFNPKHEVEATISEGLGRPGGLAIDTENRLLYVSDIGLDQVLVFDADSLRLLRKIGTTGHNHELTTPGDFAMPGGVAVDQEGNLYVADTMNNRVEIFDADGNFISTFGKNGDGPGYFARPKGVAVDGDGHIWVADGMQDRVQVFDHEGRLLTYLGGHGNLPGQFAALVGITIDKQNRVFTSEIYPGRVQQFRYVTDAEAEAERARRQAELDKKSARSEKPADTAAQKESASAVEKSSAAK
ncbi:MAG: 6-bladed beta-propeller [Acidobacteriia bacterium]|nr:6-bladed beta-propeller [Terriglobia bacterium]